MRPYATRGGSPHASLLISVSACSSQMFRSISRHIAVAAVRCSSASCRFPVRPYRLPSPRWQREARGRIPSSLGERQRLPVVALRACALFREPG